MMMNNYDINIPEGAINFQHGWNEKINFEEESVLFSEIFNNSQKENDVQSYIKKNKKWFIPASIFVDYDFGHHEAYLVPEKSLGSEYRTDYMLIGRNSISYHIVLVEFEDVNVEYNLKTNNMETETVRKGLAQIADWKRWIDKNKDYFCKTCGLNYSLPTWAIHYCLVVSRRNRMNSIANEMRGQKE